MKIYFDGDSWTKGVDLDDESQRFSTIVSNKLGSEEYNISKKGKSNNRIVRHLLLENDISQYDLAIIQMTFPNRMEYYNKKWRSISIGKSVNNEFWKQYYKEIYNDTYGSTYEEIFAMSIRNHCKANRTDLILISNNIETDVKFDLQLQLPRYPHGEGSHPSAEGHRLIADDILRLI